MKELEKRLNINKMKQFCCPDCNVKIDTCEGCQRAMGHMDEKCPDYPDHKDYKFQPSYYPEDIKKKVDLFEAYNLGMNDCVPNCCRNCPSHPSNGGDGICFCTAPYYDPQWPWKMTC